MAVRHVVDYYNKVCDQYQQMNEEIKDFQKEVENGLIEPERLDNLKKIIEPLKNNYMTLSWIMYLLNQPNRDRKCRAYQERNKKFLSKLDKNFNQEGVIEQNKNTIEEISGA